MFKKWIVLGATIGGLSNAFAVDLPRMENPRFEGTGCNPAKSSAALAPDGQTLSLIFDEFRVESDDDARPDFKTCQVLLPFTIPKGYTLSLVRADYRGFNALPKKTVAEIRTSYDFDGGPPAHPGRRTIFREKDNGEFIDTDIVRASTRCNATSPQLTIKIQLTVRGNRQNAPAFTEIDSTDIVAPATPISAPPVNPGHARRRNRGAEFKIKMEPCREGPRGRRDEARDRHENNGHRPSERGPHGDRTDPNT